MIRSLLTAAAATVALCSVASAQSLPPPTVTPAPVLVTPGTTTSVQGSIGPDGSIHGTAVQQGIGPNGQLVKEKHTYQNGPEGTVISHSQTQVDPDTGTETKSTTTTEQR